jgi:hypothetical protein
MSANVFGIDFSGSLLQASNNAYGSEFYVADSNVFGMKPFQNNFPPLPITPTPFAVYDLNNYMPTSPYLADTLGGPDATVLQEMMNAFDQTIAGNYYLSIWAPNNFPDPTGGILLPNYSNIRAIEMWVRYATWEGYGQYVLDARLGEANGFWITQGDNIGSDWNGGKFYNNTIGTAIDSGAGTPIVAQQLAGKGWCQLFFIPPKPFADDIALFIKHDEILQGMPVDVAYMALYNAIPSSTDVITIFNSKCSRYGLSPV